MRRSRCDQIIDLIDACLAEVGAIAKPIPATVPVSTNRSRSTR
jgi:hypothetical protein